MTKLIALLFALAVLSAMPLPGGVAPVAAYDGCGCGD